MIECKNISKQYKRQVIINDSSSVFRERRISFIMGPNGSGKTTFIKCLMNMESFEGRILFDGKHVNEVKKDCLVIWDDCPFYPNLSGLHNLLTFSSMKKVEIIEKAEQHIDYYLLKSKVRTYSYGQKKKLALALIEILKPSFLIMDEISNGLDYESIRQLQHQIKEWSKTMTIILTGHQFGFYEKIVEDVFIFKNHQIQLYQENFTQSEMQLEGIYDDEIG